MAGSIHLVVDFDAGCAFVPVCGSWGSTGAGWTTSPDSVTCPSCMGRLRATQPTGPGPNARDVSRQGGDFTAGRPCEARPAPAGLPAPTKPFVWKPRFCVGIESIDSEHQWFFEIINTLHDMSTVGASDGDLRLIYDELGDYARAHFANEERLLELAGHPHLSIQKRQHAFFVSQLARFPSTSREALQPLFGFARGWMLDHILGSDRASVACSARTRRP